MKNLSIGMKLIVGYAIVLLLFSASGILSVINIANIGTQIDLYGQYTVPNADHIRVMQVGMRGIMHELAEALIATDQSDIKLAVDQAGEYGKDVLAELNEYEANQRNTDRAADIQTFRELITKAAATRVTLSELLQNDSKSNHNAALSLYLDEYKPVVSQAITILDTFSATAMDRAVQQRMEATSIVALSRMEIIILCLVSLSITVVVIFVTRRSLLAPIKEIVGAYEEISRGSMNAQIKYESKDEIGQMAKLIQRTNAMQGALLGDVIDKFVKISQGDLQAKVEVEYPGDYIVLKDSIEKTIAALNQIMQTINTAAEQVSTGASQVSSGAQALAAGSTEQASSVEELNASVVIIAEHAAKNDTNVKIANNFVEQADEGVAASNDHMHQLSAAMEEIGSASGQIANITKVIEDIAFQTNILALNAAIEAARAGEAGKGFAVVADEVRTLAAKSAEAAKKTADLIQNSVDTVARGTQLTAQTAEILQAVGESTRKVTESFGKIEQASAEQAGAIEQVKQGLSQVSAVVQTNAATAEENSATSEEMSAQAATLRDEVGKFKLDTRGASAAFQPQEATPRAEALPQNGPAQEDFLLADGQADSDLGKY